MPPALQTSSRSQYAPENKRNANIADRPNLAKQGRDVRRRPTAGKAPRREHSTGIVPRLGLFHHAMESQEPRPRAFRWRRYPHFHSQKRADLGPHISQRLFFLQTGPAIFS